MIDYCLSAMPFFRLSNDKRLEEIARIGAWSTFWSVDAQNPYALFMGVSDVDYSNHWQNYTFDIYDDVRKKTIEADPERLESFQWVPNQSMQVYQELLTRGGEWVKEFGNSMEASNLNTVLTTLPHGCGTEIQWLLEGEMGESANDQLFDCKEVMALFSSITNNNLALQMHYFEVAAWAAYLWLAGPEGRSWRNTHHDIFLMCSEDGMGFLYDGSFIQKEHIIMQQRPPQSCVACGLDSYCVELAHISGTTRYLCEKHLNGDPVFDGANCGTKNCRAVMCQHHPLHGQENALSNQLRKTGQLTSRVKQGSLLGTSGTKLLQN
jgi:hypothetical protein